MKRVITLIISIFLLALSGVIYLKSNIGGDPLTVLFQGISTTFNFHHGNTVTMMNLLAVILLVILDRKKVGFATIAMFLFLGNAFNIILFLDFIPAVNNIIYSVIYASIAVTVSAFGVAQYISTNFGVSGIEGMMLLISEKFKIRVGLAKIIFDATVLVIGIIFGGVFGIGTIISCLFTGPLIDLFLNKFFKVNNLSK